MINVNSHNHEIYISLGNACGVAYNIVNHRFPFDWIRTPRLTLINKLISNHFDGFMDINNFKFVKYSNNFVGGKCIYCNTKYNLKFCHDFTFDDINKEFDIIQTKYNRRIERLYNALKSNEFIHFIRDDYLHKYKINDIKEFIGIIKDINPNIKFKITVIIHNPLDKPLDFEELNNVYYYNDKLEYGDWKRGNLNWNKII
jgi:hypothetical protein